MTIPFLHADDDRHVTADDLDDLRHRCALALRSVPRGSYISHHTAAALWTMWAPRSSTVHVSVPPRTGRQAPPGVNAHRGSFQAWTTRIGDLPVSAPPQVVVELARTLRLIDLLPLLDSLLGRTQYDLRHVRACLGGTHLRRRVLVEAMRLARPGSGSAMDSKLRLLVLKGGFPEPQVQIPVTIPTDWLPAHERSRVHDRHVRFYVDAGYEQLRLGIEYDGWYHDAPEQRRYDATRRGLLERAQWQIHVVPTRQLTGDPKTVLEIFAAMYNAQADEPVQLINDWRAIFGDRNRQEFTAFTAPAL